jgi:hypothetical protein
VYYLGFLEDFVGLLERKYSCSEREDGIEQTAYIIRLEKMSRQVVGLSYDMKQDVMMFCESV